MADDVVYEPVIGLEIHVQLSTRTKMFCGCELSFGEEPNTRTCEVCLGLPGALPVVNAESIHNGLMIGMALGCELAPRSIFHRKNYFYPDNPKAYQISQYDEPLCLGGHLGDVRIHRVHLEEDAAKLVHTGASGRIHGADTSVVDFNRGGTPLVEIVTEPAVHSADQAGQWLRLLRTTLRQLGVSDVNMEEGSLRCDANVSIRPVGTRELGTKTELKNMNSFRFIEKGIRAEIVRQEGIVRAGGQVEQETLHFDPRTEAITSLRSKEEAHDYRYFPEPDLVPIAISEAMLDRARAALPGRPDGDVGVAAQRPLLHVHVAHPELAQRRAQQPQPLAARLRRAQVGLGDDLRQRRAAAVEVHDAVRAAVDAPAGPRVDELRGVLLEVHAVDAHVAEVPATAQGLVVLADLVALGEVGIEVVLAVEDRPRRELAPERHADHQAEVDRLRVGDRQRARQAEADLARARVRRLAERQRAAAEHLRPRAELDVDLEADDRLVRHAGGRGSVGRAHARAGELSKAIACSRAYAVSRIRFSLNAGPASWKPTGRPSLSPHGIEIAGIPASGIGTVK